MITENLSTLKIHKLTQEQYDRESAAGNIDENAIYLTPDNYVSKDYVDNLLSELSNGITRVIVDALPTETSEINENTIYMVPSQDNAENNIYDEYMFFKNSENILIPEIIGSTAIDLSHYYTKAEIDEAAQAFIARDEVESDYYNATTVDELVENSIKIWQPNTEYKIGDMVATTAYGEESFTVSIIAICTQDHTSPDNIFFIDQEGSRWDWTTIYSLHDSMGNIIHDHYATKEELEEALKNIPTGEGGTITVDQTYNPESENAQSGKAVAEAIENLLENGNTIIKTEQLTAIKTASYPDLTTFEYSSGDGSWAGYCVVEKGDIKGGLLSVDWDTNDIYGFHLNIYLFDSEGNPYLHSFSADSNIQGELYQPNYAVPGDGAGFGIANAPFTTQIPESCNFIICVRCSVNAPETVLGNIQTASQFADWVVSGGITFTVSKTETQSLTYVKEQWGMDNANKVLATDDRGTVIVKEAENNLTAAINPNIKSINHRGYGTAPENTLSAYRLSKKMGFNMVECDVSITADGVPVLLHDATIDRTSNGSGNISDMTLSQVRQYDFGSWKNAEYTGEKIPTFEEFIGLCRDLGLHPYIELKSAGNYTQEQINDMVHIVKKYGMKKNVSWISFNYTFLQYVRNADNKARLGFVVGSITQNNVDDAVALLNGENDVFIDSYYEETTSAMVDLCITADMPLEHWGLDTEAKVLNANKYVNGFSTDTVVAGIILYNNAK